MSSMPSPRASEVWEMMVMPVEAITWKACLRYYSVDVDKIFEAVFVKRSIGNVKYWIANKRLIQKESSPNAAIPR